ncbi:MAG TPA: amidohydrolase [Myxococcales bacterium]|nr:amidohydrolase [Myxococcales bacterium]
MKIEDMIMISVDDHVVEPPDVFEGRLAEKYSDRAPHVVHKDDGTDVWVFEGRQMPNIGLNAVAGRPPEEYGVEPTAYEQLRPGCFDVKARIDDMNANGVLGSMCFPSFPAFCGQIFAGAEDKELAIAVLRAYNDWHIDQWCGGAPGRFIPLAIAPIWDPSMMAEEVRRVAKKGCHAVSFSENPEKLGFPSLQQAHWDPFWRACNDEGTIVCLHFGSGRGMVAPTMDAPMDAVITLMPIAMVDCAADLIWSPVLRKFPELKFALSEAGLGWFPFFLERIDFVYQQHRAWTHQDFGDKLPSEVFREHIVTCFITDPTGIANRHSVGIENITWECDYPHSDSTWPRAPETLMSELVGVPDDEIDLMTYKNAMRLFRYDPFRHMTKDQAKVGALRAQAVGVDLSLKSQGGLHARNDNGIVTAAQVATQLASAMTTVE